MSSGDQARPPRAGAAGDVGGRLVTTRRQPVAWEDLTPQQQAVVQARYAHVQEVETGYRSGSCWQALPGEPRPPFDPVCRTLTQRRAAKVAEIRAMDPAAVAAIGFTRISERTLKRLGTACRTRGMSACINGSWLRRSDGHPSVSQQVREAIYAVRAETLHRSRVSMRTRERLIHQYLRERFGPTTQAPSYWTLRRVWQAWFGPGGGRQRYEHSAAQQADHDHGQHIVIHRPGQVVALDTTVLPVQVREDVFGDPVAAHLTLALDAYTHSLVAFRLTLVSDTSLDVAMLLRDIMTPTPMRPGWGSAMAWRYPGIPAEMIEGLAGFAVAGLPFFAPETVTTDHGSVYKNHHLIEVQRVLGVNVLPSRVLRPTDKQAIERAFGAARSLLFELLPGYTGVDVADRGTDPQADAVLTLTQAEELISTWVIACWQNRELGGHAPAWDPTGRHSPNSLFAAAMAQGGFSLQIPPPQLYYELLPVHYVKVHDRRGVKIRGLWYDGPGLDPYRGQPSARGGRHKGKWVIRRDPRDARLVFFQDPDTGQWQVLRWNGLPAEGEVPCFGDARVRELLQAAKQAGLAPCTDTDLLPVLLDLLGAHVPVEQWPTQMSKTQRTEHAREVARARAADRDHPDPQPVLDQPPAAAGPAPAAPSAAPSWRERARTAETALDAARSQRRRAAVSGPPTPPSRLGETARRRGLFLVPAPDPDQEPDQHEPGQHGSGRHEPDGAHARDR